jgi:hypothetical protein
MSADGTSVTSLLDERGIHVRLYISCCSVVHVYHSIKLYFVTIFILFQPPLLFYLKYFISDVLPFLLSFQYKNIVRKVILFYIHQLYHVTSEPREMGNTGAAAPVKSKYSHKHDDHWLQ